MTDKLRIGVVGLGMASGQHAQSLIDLDDQVEVAGVYSPTQERRLAFAQRYGFTPVDSLAAIFDDKTVDAVMILTPPSSHLDLVRMAANAKKHVLLEKPLETTPERSLELVEIAESAGIKLGVVLQLRFRRTITTVRDAIINGRLGDIVSVSARLNNWRPQSYYDQPGRGTRARDGGGVLLTQAIHTLDQMIALAGMPVEVTGYATTSKVHRMETEDVAHAAMRFANGAIGAVSATTAAYPGFADSIDLLGTLGSARLDQSGALLRFMDGTEETVADEMTGSGAGADPMAFSNENHRAVLADFLAAIREDRSPLVSGREALKAHRLIEAILRSSETGNPATV